MQTPARLTGRMLQGCHTPKLLLTYCGGVRRGGGGGGETALHLGCGGGAQGKGCEAHWGVRLIKSPTFGPAGGRGPKL